MHQFYANLDISVRLETILCKCGQICASGNALMQLGTIFYKLGQICTTRNASIQLKGYMSLDGYVKQEMLLSVGRTASSEPPYASHTLVQINPQFIPKLSTQSILLKFYFRLIVCKCPYFYKKLRKHCLVQRC